MVGAKPEGVGRRAKTAAGEVALDGRLVETLVTKESRLRGEVGGPLPAPLVAAIGGHQPPTRPHKSQGPAGACRLHVSAPGFLRLTASTDTAQGPRPAPCRPLQ